MFEKLNERTNDLERLQESYVDIGDRCNDLQDEVAELQEQMVALQSALATRTMFNNSSTTAAAASAVGGTAAAAAVEAPLRVPAPAEKVSREAGVKGVDGGGHKSVSRVVVGGTNPSLSAVKSPTASNKPTTRQTIEDFEEYEDEFEDDN